MSATTKQAYAADPRTPRMSTSLQSSRLYYDDLSTERFSHTSAASLTDTRHLPYLKCEPWPDLSFLGRTSSLEDYFCDYWRYAVADGQDISVSHFLDCAPSFLAFPEVGTDWTPYDDWSWQPEGRHNGQTGARWRSGNVGSQAPNEVQIGGNVYGHEEGHVYRGVIGDSPDRRRSNVHREQDPKHQRLLTRRNAYKAESPVKSTSFTAHIHPVEIDPSASFNIPRSVSTPVPYPTQDTSMGGNRGFYSCASSSMQIPRTPSPRTVKSTGHASPPIRHRLAESSISTYNPSSPSSIPQKASGAPTLLDRSRKYAHHPSNITIPAPLAPKQPSTGPTSWDPYPDQPQEADNTVVRNPRYRKMLRFFCLNTEQKLAEIDRTIRSMRSTRQ